MYECESPTMRKAECRRIDAFELWCWRTLKEIQPVNPKRNQSWIFIRRIDADAEAPILWPPDVKSWLFGKDPDAGKDWGQDWMASLAEWAWVWASSRRWWRTGKPGVLQSLGSQRVGHDWATERQNGTHVCIPYKRLKLKPNFLCDGLWRCGLQEMTSSWGWIHHKWDCCCCCCC